jgi:site-specific DNA-methyltransferase (adenine-specific)
MNVTTEPQTIVEPKIELYNMDCMEYMKQCKDNEFHLAIVDPPYGIGESSNDNKGRSKLAKSKDYGSKNWDDNAPNTEYFKELKRVSKNQIIWGANHFIRNIPEANSSCWIVWNKENGENDFADCELAYTSFKTAVRKVDIRWHGMLQHDMKNKETRIHPTQKPRKLYEWILKNYTKTGNKILDTHLGSGSSAIASYNYKFDFVGLEIDKEYFDNAVKRFNNYKSQLTMF